MHNENMLAPAVNGTANQGKSLHQRTKSTPAFPTLLQAGAVKATNKKVLADANTNLKVPQPAKDDSEVGKASPGKIAEKRHQQNVKSTGPVGTFAPPAPRPLVTKPLAQAVGGSKGSTGATATARPSAFTAASVSEAQPVKHVVAKKSIKVLKVLVEPPRGDAHFHSADSSASAPGTHQASFPQSLANNPMSTAADVQRQDAHQTTRVPICDALAVRPLANPAVADPQVQPISSQEECDNYLASGMHQSQQSAASVVASSDVAVSAPQTTHVAAHEAEEDQYEESDYTTSQSLGLHGDSTGGVTTILAPRENVQSKAELMAAKEYVFATRAAEDIEDEQWDTSMVVEYGEEIFEYMRELEARMAPNPRYMDEQQEIQWSMRSVLMDWVVQVHQRFNLLPETLFLTANYIDRFLSCKIVSLGKLQLVGATAIFVAAKYEEVQCPTIGEIIYMVDGGYSAEELLKAERFMLSMLQFELGWPGPMSFLRRISKADDYDLETRTVAKYFLEVTLMDERFVGCQPSYLAAGAHCMSRLMLHGADWSPAHMYYSNYTWDQLLQLLLVMEECIEFPAQHHSAVFSKYQDKRYKRASNFVQGKISSGWRVSAHNPPSTFTSLPYDGSHIAGTMR